MAPASGEHSQNYSPLGPLQDVHGLGVSGALQAVTVHGDDLISTFQPAVLHGRPLQGAKPDYRELVTQ